MKILTFCQWYELQRVALGITFDEKETICKTSLSCLNHLVHVNELTSVSMEKIEIKRGEAPQIQQIPE